MSIKDIKKAIKSRNFPIYATLKSFIITICNADEDGFIRLEISKDDMDIEYQEYRLIDDINALADIIADDIKSIMADPLI